MIECMALLNTVVQSHQMVSAVEVVVAVVDEAADINIKSMVIIQSTTILISSQVDKLEFTFVRFSQPDENQYASSLW